MAPRAAVADAALIALGRDLEVAHADELRALERMRVSHKPADELAWEAANDQTHAIAERIGSVAAATVEGLRVKARAVAWCHQGGPVNFDAETTDLRLAEGIVRDLLA